MFRRLNRWSRRLHRWGAVAIAVPLLVVILSGLLLQVKKQLAWVQPPTQTGVAKNTVPLISWERILSAARSVPECDVQSLADIDRLDVRFNKGIVKVFCSNHWELQLDLETGDVLSSTYRRSDWIEMIHDGTIFGEWAKLWIFLPNGLVLLGLWITGMYLWYLPFESNRRKRSKQVRLGIRVPAKRNLPGSEPANGGDAR